MLYVLLYVFHVYLTDIYWSIALNFYGRYHNLIERYEISIFEMTMDILLFSYIFSFFNIIANTFIGLDCIYE